MSEENTAVEEREEVREVEEVEELDGGDVEIPTTAAGVTDPDCK